MNGPSSQANPGARACPVEVDGLSVRYDDVVVLQGVTLRLEAGLVYALLGASGSGKTSLLRAVLGLLAPHGGEVRVFGNGVGSLPVAERARLMGYVPQDAGLFPHLTARDNITLGARSLGWPRKQTSERLSTLQQTVQLEPTLLRRYPSELSGGQKQRIALIRGLFLDPPFVVLDEPFSALDPQVRADLQAEVKELFSILGKTVLFVTHDVAEAGYLSDSVVLLHKGRVAQTGRLEDIAASPADDYVKDFLQAHQRMQAGADR